MPHNEPTEITYTHDGETFTLFAAVHDMRHREEPEMFGGTREGLYARLDTADRPGTRPTVRHMSRLVGEHHWSIDGEFTPKGMCHHNNGFGVRYLRVDSVIDELADLLNNRAAELGLAPEIASTTPLHLTAKSSPLDTAIAAPPRPTTPASHTR